MLIPMQLTRIIISDIADQYVVYLTETGGTRCFPILIGLFEATAIDRRVKDDLPPRPLTHDLLKNCIEELGGEIQDIVINNLHDHTYYAVIRIQQDDELIEIDSRPSDAIAISVHYDPHIPIFVDESILDSVAK